MLPFNLQVVWLWPSWHLVLLNISQTNVYTAQCGVKCKEDMWRPPEAPGHSDPVLGKILGLMVGTGDTSLLWSGHVTQWTLDTCWHVDIIQYIAWYFCELWPNHQVQLVSIQTMQWNVSSVYWTQGRHWHHTGCWQVVTNGQNISTSDPKTNVTPRRGSYHFILNVLIVSRATDIKGEETNYNNEEFPLSDARAESNHTRLAPFDRDIITALIQLRLKLLFNQVSMYIMWRYLMRKINMN